MDVKRASEKWGITPRRVRILCNEGRVDGALRNGWSWSIPENTPKPKDARALRKFKNYEIRVGNVDVDSLSSLKNSFPLSSLFSSPYYNALLSRTISFLFEMENVSVSPLEVQSVLNGNISYTLTLKEHLLIVNFAYLLKKIAEEKIKWNESEIERVYSLLMHGIKDTIEYRRGSIKNGDVSIIDAIATLFVQYEQSWSNLHPIVSAIILFGELGRIGVYEEYESFFLYLVLASVIMNGGFIPPFFDPSLLLEVKASYSLILSKGVYSDLTMLIERVISRSYGELKKHV